ncbi:DUF2268 domain-containing protein [Paucisalibacillus sp. EB02]|uniref:DUF2268 domain-containing protein n=1 Tax=Paucisalibacillus sp. EB02 TaxID=1347087 RepID=UPI0004B9A931|nr:DUF2268 domain-containing protein [Paucisalibacillus sp. EB02]
MPVYQTDKWLDKSYHSPEHIFRKLTKYFYQGNVKEVKNLLINHGMYHRPEQDGELLLKTLRKKNVWEIITKEELKLKQEWNGKNIPIFILPSDTYNRKIREHYRGKSGLAFRDKLFLFLSTECTEKEIKALFAHEYNHCCRLVHDPTKEKDYTLLNVIILEGLAENAVRERFGTSLLAPWTSYYNEDELQNMWKHVVFPHKDLSKSNRNANNILYGKNFYPNMAGYAVGYYLVQRYMQKTGKSSKELLEIPAEEIALIEK